MSFPSLEEDLKAKAVPLEEQVAMAEPQPVSKVEENMSAPPIIDKPLVESGQSFIPPSSKPGAFKL